MVGHTKVTERPLVEQAYEERIIDLDFHLHIPYPKIIPYIEDSYIRKAVEESGVPPNNNRPLVASYAKNTGTTEKHDRVHGVAANREEIRDVCDELALDAAVIQPGTNLPLHRNNYPVITNELARAYNDYILDRVVDVENEIYGALFVPYWDVDFAVEELDRLGNEKGMVAAQAWLDDYKWWGHTDYDPIFQKVTDLDMNMILHISGTHDFWNPGTQESTRSHMETGIDMASVAMSNIANMIVTGVFDKFPDLNVSVQEAGTDWIPFLAYILDERYQIWGYDIGLTKRFREMDEERLQKTPSEYVFEHINVATQPVVYPNIPRSDHAGAMLKAAQAENTFQYTSDWPHGTLDPVNWVYNTPSIDDDLRARILHENAEEFLRLPN